MQGMVLTADSAARQLKSMNRDYNNKLTWQNALNSVDASAASAQQQLQKSYTDASAQAYASFLQNRAALENSGYIGAGAQALGKSMNDELNQMYDSYLSTRNEQSSAIETARLEQQGAIEEMLAEQGEMTAAYDKAHYDYLNWLYENKPEYFEEGGIFEDMMYISEDPDNPEVRLKTMNELFMSSTNEAGEQTGLYQPLYDKDGNPTGEYELTMKGVDWYDRIENQLDTLQGNKDYNGVSYVDAGNYTFGEYLSQTDEDLHNWANSYNPWNYTEAGTNAGTFKTMYGMASTDTAYSFAERFGGITKGELNQKFTDMKEAFSDVNSLDPDKYVEQIFELAKSFGISDDLQEMGLTQETLKEVVNQYLTSDNTNDYALGAGMTGAIGGAAVGTAILPGIGTAVAAGIGALAGLIGGTAQAHAERAEQRKKNDPKVRKAYDDLLVQMTNIVMQKRRQQEINFNSGIYR